MSEPSASNSSAAANTPASLSASTASPAKSRNTPTILTIAGVCFVRDSGAGPELLTVRKRGTDKFMLPGGKLEPGESAREAAVREVGEEIGCSLDSQDLTLVGRFDEIAANEADTRVDSTIFLAQLTDEPHTAAEIEELRWTSLKSAPADLAPLLAIHVIPALLAGY